LRCENQQFSETLPAVRSDASTKIFLVCLERDKSQYFNNLSKKT